MTAYCQAISTIWTVNTPIIGVGFILGTCRRLRFSLRIQSFDTDIAVLFLKNYSLKRNIIRGGAQNNADLEAGQAEQVAEANPSDLPIDPAAGDDQQQDTAGEKPRSSISKEDTQTIAEMDDTQKTQSR